MYPATELLRTSFIKGIVKTTASVTVLGVVGLFYYLYNNVFDEKQEKQDIYKKPKLDVKNLAKVFNKDKDNKKENVEISKTGEIKETSTVETCDSADVDNIVDTEVNYIHDLDVFEKNVYEEKNNRNFKKLFDRL